MSTHDESQSDADNGARPQRIPMRRNARNDAGNDVGNDAYPPAMNANVAQQ